MSLAFRTSHAHILDVEGNEFPFYLHKESLSIRAYGIGANGKRQMLLQGRLVKIGQKGGDPLARWSCSGLVITEKGPKHRVAKVRKSRCTLL